MDDSDANLRELLDKIAKENKIANYNMKIKPISSDGANYSSKLYLATISNNTKELNLFTKVITLSEKLLSEGLENIFKVEPYVYTELSQIYRQLEEKHNVSREHRLEFPKFYGHNSTPGQEAVVLEDLSAQGYNVYDRFQSIDWPYAFKAVKELAKLHALSFAFEYEQPEEFGKAQKFLVNSFLSNEQMKAAMMGLIESVLSVAKGENRHRLLDFIKNEDLMLKVMEYLKPLRRTVLIHGDFRMSNLMHKADNEGMYQLKILDYQMMQPGSPVIDLLYFIFSGTDEEFRAKHYLPLIDHYYSQLSLAMRRLGLKPNEIYSRDDFDTELKMKLPYGLIISIWVLPIVLVEVEDAPVIDKDTDISAMKIEKMGKLYPDRINGILNDYVKWKVI